MLQESLVFLIVASLMILPRLFLRLGLPVPLTAFAMGVIPTLLGHSLEGNHSWDLMATLGITSLFLLAGIRVDLSAMKREKGKLIRFLAVQSWVLLGAGVLIFSYGSESASTAFLLVLAVSTPSAGFIIDTLDRLPLSEPERFWVSNKAVAAEILALLMMFIGFTANSPTVSALYVGESGLSLVLLVVAIPFSWFFLGRLVLPHAPGAEFSLLIMMAGVAGFASKNLGVHYLVGAFVVGLTAVALRKRFPTIASAKNIDAIASFSTFFVPFYFFVTGTRIPEEAMTLRAFLWGLFLLATVIPARWLIIWVQRRIGHRPESALSSLRIAVALTPTLVFTLVISEMLLERGAIPPTLYGALMTYAVLNTFLPSLSLRYFGGG